MNMKQFREQMRVKFGKGKYRITSDGEVHVHGLMPNSNVIGWYLYAYVGTPRTSATPLERARDTFDKAAQAYGFETRKVPQDADELRRATRLYEAAKVRLIRAIEEHVS